MIASDAVDGHLVIPAEPVAQVGVLVVGPNDVAAGRAVPQQRLQDISRIPCEEISNDAILGNGRSRGPLDVLGFIHMGGFRSCFSEHRF
ncbi:hypothetical protein [Paratractidigestivibacter sp.]|uniref:hypothetical protein n=1 Tax=Paratractidigestivibacter sp. TaxID=2847316 RepID=UPI002AC98B2E|nr:hypothetical protein [Paratractidigestivibacter sp.]